MRESQLISDRVSLVLLNNDLNLSILTHISCIRFNSVPALYDAVFEVTVITDVNIIEHDTILDCTIIADVNLLKDYRILNITVDNASAGNKTVLNA